MHKHYLNLKSINYKIETMKNYLERQEPRQVLKKIRNMLDGFNGYSPQYEDLDIDSLISRIDSIEKATRHYKFPNLDL